MGTYEDILVYKLLSSLRKMLVCPKLLFCVECPLSHKQKKNKKTNKKKRKPLATGAFVCVRIITYVKIYECKYINRDYYSVLHNVEGGNHS